MVFVINAPERSLSSLCLCSPRKEALGSWYVWNCSQALHKSPQLRFFLAIIFWDLPKIIFKKFGMIMKLLQLWPIYDPGSSDMAWHTPRPRDQSAQRSPLCNSVIICTGVIFCYLSILHLEMEPEDPLFQQHFTHNAAFFPCAAFIDRSLLIWFKCMKLVLIGSYVNIIMIIHENCCLADQWYPVVNLK